MARFGKQAVTIPEDVSVITEGSELNVKGTKGEIKKILPKGVSIEIKDNQAFVKTTKTRDPKQGEMLKGTFRAHLANMVRGVSEGWTKSLEINGPGYRASVEGNKLVMMIGYSHPVEMEIPEGISVLVEKNVLNLAGYDKEMLGQFAANIRAQRPPEPYKGSGIKYADEVIRRKAGKQAAKAGTT
jgi:large subunit ribosomal protein L6